MIRFRDSKGSIGGIHDYLRLTMSRSTGEDDNDKDPPPETTEQIAYRNEVQAELIEEFCPEVAIREPLLGLACEDESYSSLARRWGHDRRTVQDTIVPREHDNIRTRWIRRLADVAVTSALIDIEGTVIVNPWLIETIASCVHAHEVAAEITFSGIDLTVVETFLRDNLTELMAGPPNRHFQLMFNSASNRCTCRVLGHRRAAGVVAQPAVPFPLIRRRAA